MTKCSTHGRKNQNFENKKSKKLKNPFEGLTPQQPSKVDLSQFGTEYDHYEALGVKQFEKTGIVMVAGGLGERLGYNGIKIDIAVETLESTPYISHYAHLQDQSQQRAIC